MTQRAQELFLAYAHFCGERGVEPLIPIVKQAVTEAVSSIELSAKLGADHILQVFSDAHTSKTSCPSWQLPAHSTVSVCMSCVMWYTVDVVTCSCILL